MTSKPNDLDDDTDGAPPDDDAPIDDYEGRFAEEDDWMDAPRSAAPPPDLAAPPVPSAAPPPSFMDYPDEAAAPPPSFRAYDAAPAPAPSAIPVASSDPSNGMPWELQQQLTELEQWALLNQRDARRDALGFWSLKIPAILASASAGMLAHFELVTVGVIMGAVASVCVIIDGILPRGMLRNTHLRAFHDLRMLSTNMMSQWRSRSSTAKPDNIARRIIRDAEEERQRIATYIRDAEAALQFKHNA